MTGQAIHGRGVEIHLVHVEPECRLSVVQTGQRRLNLVEILALVVWVAGPPGLNVPDHAVGALFLRDLMLHTSCLRLQTKIVTGPEGMITTLLHASYVSLTFC